MMEKLSAHAGNGFDPQDVGVETALKIDAIIAARRIVNWQTNPDDPESDDRNDIDDFFYDLGERKGVQLSYEEIDDLMGAVFEDRENPLSVVRSTSMEPAQHSIQYGQETIAFVWPSATAGAVDYRPSGQRVEVSAPVGPAPGRRCWFGLRRRAGLDRAATRSLWTDSSRCRCHGATSAAKRICTSAGSTD